MAHVTDYSPSAGLFEFNFNLIVDLTYSGLTFHGIAGLDVAFGQVLYLAPDGMWYLTDPIAQASTMPHIAIVVVGGALGEDITLMEIGFIRNDAWAWVVIGTPLFLSIVPGDLAEHHPGAGTWMRVAGHVHEANILFFSSSKDWFHLRWGP